MRPLTITGGLSGRSTAQIVVRFLLHEFGQCIHGEHHRVGSEFAILDGNRITARFLVCGIERNRLHGQIPAMHLDRPGLTGLDSQGKDTGQKRNLTERDPIHEILAPR